MPLDINKLLEPLPGENPCGLDLDAEGKLAALELIAAGKPETQWSAAVPPEWNTVRRECEEVFRTGKHVRAAVITTASLLQTEGLGGFVRGLELLHGLLSRYWESLYPVLDASDNNNPIDRSLTIGALSAPVGTLGDTLQIVLSLRRTVLFNVPQVGPVNAAMLLAARGQAPALPDQPAMDAAMADAALRGATTEKVAAAIGQIERATLLVQAIAQTFAEKAPNFLGPDFGGLERELESYRALLLPFSGSSATAAPASEVAASAASAAPASGAGGQALGAINTPDQVIRALDEICRYYEVHQPASPLPLLIQRVRRLAKADFLTIVEDLAPDSVSQFKTATGFKEATPPS